MKLLLPLLLALSFSALAQQRALFTIDSIPQQGVLLDKGWKYKEGDNMEWAKPDFDDSNWASIDPTKELSLLPDVFNPQVKWLRIHLDIKDTLPEIAGLAINQAGVSEIYLNGKLIQRFGNFDTNPDKVKAYDPLEYPVHFPVDTVGRYTLAVRYALQPHIGYTEIFTLTKNRLFNATVVNLIAATTQQREFRMFYIGTDIFKIGIFFILLILHFVHYLFQRQNKTHLFLAIYLLANLLVYTFKLTGQNMTSVEYRYFPLNFSIALYTIGLISTVLVFYRIAKVRLDIYFYLLVAYSMVQVSVTCLTYGEIPWHILLTLISSIVSSAIFIRLIRIGLKKKIKGFWTLATTILIALFCLLLVTTAMISWNFGFATLGYKVMNNGLSPYFIEAIFALGGTAIPIGLSLFMGIEGREINLALSKQVSENEILKNKAIEQEKEKQQILESQKEMLEIQVNERTAQLHQSLENLKTTQSQLIQAEKMASLGELTAGIAHEIQNPLNFVNNFSELSMELVNDIKTELTNPEIDITYINELFEDLNINQEKIHHHGKRASNIVKGMLQHSRKGTEQMELTDINALCDEYFRLAYHGLRAKDKSFNSEMKTDFDPTVGTLSIHSQDIGRVILNIITNAFHAVMEKSRKQLPGYQPKVLVQTKKADNHVVISIQDNGLGIPDAIKEKIFQPFFTTKPSGEGTGLGLSLAYDIITKGHEGTIEVNSTEGIGTEFIITLFIHSDSST